MAETKPLASLSSGLLARKGQAKPAMRRQGLDTTPAGPAALDDLGWNDMGWEGGDPPCSPAREAIETLREAVEAPRPDRTAPSNPARLLTPEPASVSAPAVVAEPASAPQPAAAQPDVEPTDDQPTRTVPPIALRRARRQARPRTGRTATGKAAFTLRLDAERHLKLRLAAALERRSAQAIVTQALDRFLDQLDDLDHVLGQLPRQKG